MFENWIASFVEKKEAILYGAIFHDFFSCYFTVFKPNSNEELEKIDDIIIFPASQQNQ